MEYESILFGFAMGLLATVIGVRLQRSWQEFDDKRFRQKVLESLIVEIQNGLERTNGLIDLHNQGIISISIKIAQAQAEPLLKPMPPRLETILNF